MTGTPEQPPRARMRDILAGQIVAALAPMCVPAGYTLTPQAVAELTWELVDQVMDERRRREKGNAPQAGKQ